jgi:hypothetical protein
VVQALESTSTKNALNMTSTPSIRLHSGVQRRQFAFISCTEQSHVKVCLSCSHGMERPQVASGGERLQMWRKLRTTDEGRSYSLGAVYEQSTKIMPSSLQVFTDHLGTFLSMIEKALATEKCVHRVCTRT